MYFLPVYVYHRCSQTVLGGTVSPRGLRSSVFSKVVCDRLRCLGCNLRVSTFMNSEWKPGLDYLFFRNAALDTKQLNSKLDEKMKSVAYCCQCNWIHTSDDRVVKSGDVMGMGGQDLQWVCAGHSS